MWLYREDWLELNAKIDSMNHRLKLLVQLMVKEMADFSKLQADVSSQTTVVDSVKTLLDQLSKAVADLKGQINDPAAQAAIDALVTQIDTNNAALSAAVTANTP